MSSPLDTLFRPTTLSPISASAPPVRERGTHTRAGNAMSRTRAALMSGAAAAVATAGTRITMAQVATSAGVAKATLYNHFRTRDAVLAALVLHQVEQIVQAQEGKALTDALTGAASAISTHPVRAGLARVEPAALAALGRVDLGAEGWRLAHDAIRGLLEESGRGGASTVLRWLASYLLSPAREDAIAADVEVLVAGLPVVPPTAVEPAPAAVEPSSDAGVA